MHTAAELEAKARKSERWRRPLGIAAVLLSLVSLALSGRRGETSLARYLREHGWPAITSLCVFWATAASAVAYAWLEWRIARLADAIARARTVAQISGRSNPRVGVLG